MFITWSNTLPKTRGAVSSFEQVARTLEEKIREIAKVTADDNEFSRDVHLFDYGYLDSYSATELLTFSEQTFQIQVLDRDLAHRPLNTISEFAHYVLERKACEQS